MTATAFAPTRAAAAAPCGDCGELVLARYNTDQRLVVLDAEPEPGGLYRIDRHGRAQRRSLVLLYQEARAHVEQPGYQPHECTPRDWYDRD